MSEHAIADPWKSGNSRLIQPWKASPTKGTVPRRSPEAADTGARVDRVIGEALDAVTTRDQVVQILEKTESDWRSAASIAREIGTSESRLEKLLENFDGVRRPLGARGPEEHHYRLASRGLTRREKVRYVNLVLSRRAR